MSVPSPPISPPPLPRQPAVPPVPAGLRACRHCRHPVAPAAPNCPQCGGKTPGASPHTATVGTVLGLVVLFGCCVLPCLSPPGANTASQVGTEGASQPRPLTEAERVDRAKSDAWGMAKVYVTERLKAPSTADFGGFFSGNYQSSDTCVRAVGNDVYLARGWVDSQNSFGAMIRTKFTVRLRDDKNGNWTLLEEPTFVSP